jgi:hypothetical protein
MFSIVQSICVSWLEFVRLGFDHAFESFTGDKRLLIRTPAADRGCTVYGRDGNKRARVSVLYDRAADAHIAFTKMRATVRLTLEGNESQQC